MNTGYCRKKYIRRPKTVQKTVPGKTYAMDWMPADKTGYTASIFDVLKKLFLLWHRLPIPAFSGWPPFHKKQ